MRSFDEILAKIAHDNGTTPEDVLHEMQVAIDDAYDHHDQEAQQLWDRMTFKGDNMRRLWSHITTFKRFGLLLGASWITPLTCVIPHRNQLIPRAVILLFIVCFDIICTGT